MSLLPIIHNNITFFSIDWTSRFSDSFQRCEWAFGFAFIERSLLVFFLRNSQLAAIQICFCWCFLCIIIILHDIINVIVRAYEATVTRLILVKHKNKKMSYSSHPTFKKSNMSAIWCFLEIFFIAIINGNQTDVRKSQSENLTHTNRPATVFSLHFHHENNFFHNRYDSTSRVYFDGIQIFFSISWIFYAKIVRIFKGFGFRFDFFMTNKQKFDKENSQENGRLKITLKIFIYLIRVLSRVFNEFTMWMWMINDSQHWIVSFYIHFIFTSSIKVDVIYLMSNQKNPNSNNNTITVEWIFKRAHCCRFAFFYDIVSYYIYMCCRSYICFFFRCH